MKNCRNCKHADWARTSNGRRRFYLYTECTAPIDLSQIPASANDAIAILKRKRGVAQHDNKPVDCSRWEKA